MAGTSVCVRAGCGYAAGTCGSCPLEATGTLSEPVDALTAPAAGLAEELARFHDENRLALIKYARSRGLDRQDAEDVVNDTFLTLHRKHDVFALALNPRAFAFKVLSDCLVNHVRRSGRRPAPVGVADSLAGDASATHDPIEALVQALDVHRAIGTLSARQIDCLRLHYVAGLDTAEVASVLGISPSAVTSHLHQARHQLKERLPGYGSKEDDAR